MQGQVRLRQFLGQVLRLGQARRAERCGLIYDIRNVGLGQVKAISGPSAVARTGQGAERCGHISYTKKYTGTQKKAKKLRRPLLKNTVVRRDKWKKRTTIVKTKKIGKQRFFLTKHQSTEIKYTNNDWET